MAFLECSRPRAVTLICQESEELVLDDRAAERAAVQILMEWRALPRQSKVAGKIHEGVAVVFKAASVDRVCTGLDGLINDRTTVASELRIDGAGDEIDFSQSVWIDFESLVLEREVVDIDSVKPVGVGAVLAAVDRGGAGVIRGLHDAGRKPFQRGGVTQENGYVLICDPGTTCSNCVLAVSTSNADASTETVCSDRSYLAATAFSSRLALTVSMIPVLLTPLNPGASKVTVYGPPI